MAELEALTAKKEAIETRRKRRAEADKKDRQELERLRVAIERATAKALVGKTVVLNPNTSIGSVELRKLRGMTAIVKSIGNKYIHVRFENGECWRTPFYMVVEATPENAARISDGHQIDSVNDLANAALARL